MLSAFANSLKIPELRSRIFFTFWLVVICRLISAIPAPGIDPVALADFMTRVQQSAAGGFVGLFNLFSGGALERFAVGALGIMPYISASIILQLMTAVVPSLERLSREGDAGRQKISQYTRYLTIFLCFVQGYMMAATLETQTQQFGEGADVVINPGFGFRILMVITLTTGTMLLMWLGEQITERGIGNGISIIITIGIISMLPAAITQLIKLALPVAGGESLLTWFHVVALLVTFLLVTAGTVAVTQAQRKIPVQHAKRMVGRKVQGGGSTFMPLRLNYAGVMPIIFAQAILMFPPMLLNFMPYTWAAEWAGALSMDSKLYLILYSIMILFFSYFWVATQFNPIQIADDLKKRGAYVPGIRPGKPTAEYLDNTMSRLTIAGATFLVLIAIFPSMLSSKFNIDMLVASFFGGTSLLIMVGVVLDTMRQVESHLLTRHYDGFLKKGRLAGRR
jgi:preprotein translocase subunit SecY